MEKKNLFKNLLLSNAYQILLVILPLITAPYISRTLGAEGVGIYSYTNSLQLIFSLFATLGTQAYGTREIARHRDFDEKKSILFWEIELLSIITSSITISVWLLFVLVTNQYQLCFLILTCNLFAAMFDVSWFFAGIEKFKFIIVPQLLFKILGVICIFLFINDSSDIYIYILIMSSSTLMSNLGMWFFLFKCLKRVKFKEIKIFYHLKETIVYFIPAVATSIYTILNKTLLGCIVRSESENGYYEQATKIIDIAKAITFAGLNSVMGSRISYLFAQNEYDEIKEKINNSINYILFMGIAIGFGLIGIADRFVPLFFGAGYDEVIILIQISSPLVLLVGISNCLGAQYYNPAGKRRLSTKYIIIGSIINLLLNLLFIPKFYSRGALSATIIAEFVIVLLYLYNCEKMVQALDIFKMALKKFIAGVLMLIIIRSIGVSGFNNIVVLLLQICVGGGAYVALLILWRDSFAYEMMKKIYKIIKKD